jgi:hypothetical protein
MAATLPYIVSVGFPTRQLCPRPQLRGPSAYPLLALHYEASFVRLAEHFVDHESNVGARIPTLA